MLPIVLKTNCFEGVFFQQSCSSLRSSCWDSSHELQADFMSHQSFLSRASNQARAAFLSSNRCRNGLIRLAEQALYKIHIQAYCHGVIYTATSNRIDMF